MTLSIRFQLTLWYSCILLLAILVFTGSVRVYSEYQFRKTPQEVFEQVKDPEARALFQRSQNRPPDTKGEGPAPAEVRQLIEQVREEDQAQVQQATIIILFVVMFLSFGGGYIITGRLLKPIRKITEATHIVDSDNLDIHVAGVNTNDELGELVGNFNAMLRRLHEAFAAQKRFVENASHELKTPLTIVQTNLESVRDDATAVPVVSEAIDQSLQSTQFMNRLIEDLLLLSLPQDQMTRDMVNIVEVVQRAVDQLTPIAERDGKVIHLDIASEAVMREGSATLLQRAFMNCIENAIKYGAHTISVTVSSDNDNAVVRIHDDGAGIPVGALSHVTERFYRVDDSRARHTGGTGLGLAITQSIIEKHHGTVVIDSQIVSENKQSGTTITLTV